MKITLLGTGTSQGVPVLGCSCEVCKSDDSHDKRFRTSALVETESTRLLIDCGPDFREQMLQQPFRKIDGVLITHIHYDHVSGLDDLRPYCKFGDIDIYCEKNVAKGLRHNLPYCFPDDKQMELYPGVPKLNLKNIDVHEMLRIGDLHVMPIRIMHDTMPILGFRIGKLAYITDMKSIDDSELEYLNGVEVLVVNALRWDKPHHSHQLVADAINFSEKIGAKKTFLTHLTHSIGLDKEANNRLPKGVQLGFDGEIITI
jgi:phosphoribosyl 1,2-cyclic phosphate phosphodiesterase